jgi:hypothetical protein
MLPIPQVLVRCKLLQFCNAWQQAAQGTGDIAAQKPPPALGPGGFQVVIKCIINLKMIYN